MLLFFRFPHIYEKLLVFFDSVSVYVCVRVYDALCGKICATSGFFDRANVRRVYNVLCYERAIKC